MKQKVIFIALAFLFVAVGAFAQTPQARINSQTGTSSGSVCVGTAFNLIASISTGDLPGDAYAWYEQVNGGPATLVSNVATFTAPIDAPGTAQTGESYFYTLVITRGGTNYFAFRTVNVKPLPTVGNILSFTNDPCTGTVEVQVDGLGATFPLTVKLYASDDPVDDGASTLIGTKTGVITNTTTITVTALPWLDESRHIYLYVEDPATGCIIGK